MRIGRVAAPIVGFATVAVLVAVVAVAWNSEPERESGGVQAAQPVGGDGVALTPGFPPRERPTQTWTGDRLFVFGGLDPDGKNWPLLNDAALIEPGSGETEVLPVAPFDPPLFFPQAIATPRHVLVIGISCRVAPGSGDQSVPTCDPGTYAAATIDLEKREWNTVKIPPELAGFTTARTTGVGATLRGLGATSDGRAVVQLGVYRAEQYWTYTPASNEWQRLPDPGIRSDTPPCVSDDKLFVLTTRYEHNGAVVESEPTETAPPGEIIFGSDTDGYVEPSLGILDLHEGASWQLTSAAEGTKFKTGPPRLACMGGFAMAVSQMSPSESLAVYNLEAESWSIPAPSPLTQVFSGEVWTGQELIFLPLEIEVGAPGAAYDPISNSWRTLSGFPAVIRGAVWSGSALVGYSEPLLTTPPLQPDQITQEDLDQQPVRNTPGIFQYAPKR